MKVDQNVNHDGKQISQIFGIPEDRLKEIDEFLKQLVLESILGKLKRSQLIVRVIEFATSTIEAVIMYGYLEEKRNEANKLVGAIFGTSKRGIKKTGEIEIENGKIKSISGDEIPDEVIDDLKNLVKELEQFKPTGNMSVDGNGNLT